MIEWIEIVLICEIEFFVIWFFVFGCCDVWKVRLFVWISYLIFFGFLVILLMFFFLRKMNVLLLINECCFYFVNFLYEIEFFEIVNFYGKFCFDMINV